MTIGSVTSLNPMYTTKAFITRTWLAKGPNLRRGIIFSDFSQTNYLNIYRTDLHEICRIGRTLSVDERSEVIFVDSSRDVAVVTNFVGRGVLLVCCC